jgi:hypothetical protein
MNTLLEKVAGSPNVQGAVHPEEQRIYEQRLAAVAELESLRAQHVENARALKAEVETAEKHRLQATRFLERSHVFWAQAVGRNLAESCDFQVRESRLESIVRRTAPPELNELLQIVGRVEDDARASFRSRTVGTETFRSGRGEILKQVHNGRRIDAIVARCKAVRDAVEKLFLTALPRADVLDQIEKLRESLAD